MRAKYREGERQKESGSTSIIPNKGQFISFQTPVILQFSLKMSVTPESPNKFVAQTVI